MKCKFCNQQTIPIGAEINSDQDYRYGHWICGKCPQTVKYRGSNFSIYCFYNNRWYEVSYSGYSKTYRIYFVDCYKMTEYGAAEDPAEKEYNRVNIQLVLEIPPGLEITPSNVQEKLPTLLVFS